ncbi:hypothetical protein J3Q64DRAFT_1733080 [Phycomyces blakesleeanus]|uniref:DUF423-domain-containing protein n=2 Tax=Phycomyces blakesleeanus TaxID=4837 RepID=A0A162TXY5_PHYB8|nr:hypothetical protein PHYBLDRAFT_187457 [Phycomyces blakesleeanus NRRL 1555(-)]OAD71892.1 hypothetical protein PHYBLDRAFT_187457 [Phycomyces blakesleeanus NRRL 1555(-)]|eukprot:XP_018289932.1 hypothetical protein PHYBLDRAFT_187457 [Phycomyces blakesleeanus NRRL 1555(-)]
MGSDLYWKAGSLLGLTAIGLGAFGAHALAKYTGNDDAKLRNWKTASEYQLLHAVALLAVSSIPVAVRRVHPAAMPLMLGGTIAFSGSIYLLTLDRDRFRPLGPVTPLGGLAMMAGWAALLL